MLNEEKKITLKQYLSVVLQLGLFLLVVRQFQIENPAFFRIVLLTSVGFMVHAFLPLRFRLLFFLLLSFGGIGLVFGFPNSLWLVGVGVGLIGICHLPFSFATRVSVLLITGATLAALRTGWISAPWSSAVWPILGSMFMFRLIVYLYDLRHETVPPSVSRTLSYFFLLPNVCFPLFPVVDYKTFHRTYYDDDPYKIYQRGMDWMTRGLIQLLLYRFVYYHLTFPESEVTNRSELIQFLLANLFLYLRISGHFHLVVGMLHLFGFHLPETHHRYFLASSFTDYWRRINIYWKDFMLKLFYYPAYFKLRRWGNTPALIGSTLVVFVATWFLHAYQWFWLRGSFLLSASDALFWSILAFLVVVNSLYEAKHSGGRNSGKVSGTFRDFASLSLRTAGTFFIICTLWSLWISESPSEWASLWTVIADPPSGSVAVFPFLFLAIVLSGGHAQRQASTEDKQITHSREKVENDKRVFNRTIVVNITGLLFIYLLGKPTVSVLFGVETQTLIESLKKVGLSRRDADLLQRGYYEDLLDVNHFNSQLWELYSERPPEEIPFDKSKSIRETNNFLQYELVPLSENIHTGVTIQTNRWGMRDQDYEQKPDPHTYRIALIGSSYAMGWGVEGERNFETLLENRLNSENVQGLYNKYEILNFAVGGYSSPQHLFTLEEKVFAFEPNAVFYVAHSNDMQRTINFLVRGFRDTKHIPYDYLQQLLQKAIHYRGNESVIVRKRLEPFQSQIISWLYQRIVAICREHQVIPVWVFLPEPGEHDIPQRSNNISHLLRLAEEAGFVVINLTDIYEGREPLSLFVSKWDFHPNAKGHELIAARLYDALIKKKELLSFNHVANAETARK